MTKPKILFVITLPPPVHGAAMMGQYIFESKPINESFDCEYINLQTSKKLSDTGRNIFAKIGTILGLYKRIFLTLKKRDYDLCYMSITASGAGFYKDVLVVFILKLFRCKILYHFQNKGVSNDKSFLSKLLYKFTFKNTKSILLSPHLYHDIEDYVAKENVFYCPNAGTKLETEFHKKWSDNNQNHKNVPCKFLYLSNMIVQKGVFVLLEACHKLKDRGIDFECHFVGGWTDITEDEFTEMVSSAGLTKNVFFHGPKYGKEKLSYFENSDVFIFPTFYHYEAFPLVTLEAMQHFLPIISTPEGGIPEIVIEGETGFLVPQRDSVALSEKMEILANDSNLRVRMGESGEKRFTNMFTLPSFEKRMVNILTESCKERAEAAL